MNIFASFGMGCAGGLFGALAVTGATHLYRQLREIRAWKKKDEEMGGLPNIALEQSSYLPPIEERRAIGRLATYMIELGELAPTIQNEAHAIARLAASGEEYTLTPETARYLIIVAGLKQPNNDRIMRMLDEACDMLGEEHIAWEEAE